MVSFEKNKTASNFGDILNVYCKQRNCGIPSISLLKKLFDPPKLDKIKVVMWGKGHEKVALQRLTSEYGIKVSPTGIWLHECGFLGATRDGLVGDNAIVEVKCPYSFRNDDLIDVLSEKSDYVVKFDRGDCVVNKNHPYYHQIQGQLHLTKRVLCYFVLWSTKSMVVLNVLIEPSWSSNICVLKKFYCDHFIPDVKEMCPA